MFDFLGNLQRDLHPIIVHFPIALLVLSFTLSLFWQRNERLNAGLLAAPRGRRFRHLTRRCHRTHLTPSLRRHDACRRY